ncbi:hypothetical protein MOQ_001938 [Trypanosoma cruzi marinkellei]|uniref:Uncharacterized protein n=1 Tax=Trypanosoma cruzi marinkellei TaxID=85056 RepID=K2NF15_TRYCR|nr:hypothetical protein MOQ_001938 [Trypanosoma cruzi marinkellei]
MREEEAIVSLGAVCISLYQCQPLASSGSPCVCDIASDYRGDVLVPFYRGSATYRELAEGVEYRLNQYFVVHPAAARKPSAAEVSTQNKLMHAVNSGSSVYKNNNSSSGSDFNGSYVCSRCTGCNDAGKAAHTQTEPGIFEEYPRIVVRNFTRARNSQLGEDDVTYEEIDEKLEVTEDNLRCFFYYVKEKCTKTTSPILLKDGSIKRPQVGRDHVHPCTSDSSYADCGKVQQHIELKVGGRLLRIGTSAEQRFEDVFKRLKSRNIRVHRIFDGVTGASILPCELVRHLSWKVSSLCAEVAVPLSSGVGMKRQRIDEVREENTEDEGLWMREKEEDHEEARTLISLSEVSTGAYGGTTLCLTSGSIRSSSNTHVNVDEERRSWEHEKLLHKTTFGFDEDDDTVPLLDVLSQVPHDSLACSAEAVESSTPLRSFYLDDDSYMSSAFTGVVNDTGGSSVAFATPMQAEKDILIHDSGVRRYGVGSVHGEYSPIMVTQQSLPDFFLDNSDDNDEEEEYDN